MTHTKFAGRAVRMLGLMVAMSAAMISCIPDNSDLGLHILPGDDSIAVYTDTIYDIHGMIVESYPIQTSHSVNINANQNATLYMGSLEDSLRGKVNMGVLSTTSITFSGEHIGLGKPLDSLAISMYVSSVTGDSSELVNLRVYEITEEIIEDSVYYSNYDMTGKFNENPLVDENVELAGDSLYTFYLDDQDFYDKVVNAVKESVFDSVHTTEDVFRGFYFTAEAVNPDKNVLSEISLGYYLSRLSFKYLPDSVGVDTAEYLDHSIYSLTFNPRYCQWINTFEHDYSSVSYASKIDVVDAEPEVAYINGLAGVNYKLNLSGLEDFIAENPGVSINGANLLFYVVPDSISGIDGDDLPGSLMIEALQEDGSRLYLFDYITNGSGGSGYGKLIRDNSQSAFLDPVYYYKFNISQHVQSLLMGTLDNTDLLINVTNPATSTDAVKFWSNYSGREGGLRLELIYSKF